MEIPLPVLVAIFNASVVVIGVPATNKVIGNRLGTLDTGAAKPRLMFKKAASTR